MNPSISKKPALRRKTAESATGMFMPLIRATSFPESAAASVSQFTFRQECSNAYKRCEEFARTLVRRRSRAFVYSFVLTLVILGGLALVLYLNSGPVTTNHLPTTLPHYHPVWGKYVPSDAIYLGMVNYSMIAATNSSLPRPGSLVTLTSPRVSINRSDVAVFVEVALATPNATIDLTFLRPSSYSTVAGVLATRGAPPYYVDGYQIYPIVTTANAQPIRGLVALLPDDYAVEISLGVHLGVEAVTKSLDVATGKVDSILSRTDIPPLFYIVGGATNHYAIDIQNFPGVVLTGQLTMTSVDQAGSYVQVSNVVEFSDPKVASSQVQTVRSAYLLAHQFVVYDSFVKAIEFHPIASLEAEVGLTR